MAGYFGYLSNSLVEWGLIAYYVLCPMLVVRQIAMRTIGSATKWWSIAVLVLATVYTFCIPVSTIYIRGFCTRLKSEVAPDQLQDWAVGFIKAHPEGYPEQSQADIPEFIRKVKRYGHPVLMPGKMLNGGQPEVSLEYLYFEVIVGNTNLAIPTSLTSIQWKPGIYVVDWGRRE